MKARQGLLEQRVELTFLDKGNFHKCGIDYRLRFLQKSHISLKRSDDVLFACVFCVQAGKTMDECDATVFAGSQALFNHLAHHPRPLPKIPGIAVVEDESMPARLMNDYDLHFRAPAIAHPAQMNVTQIHGKPTGFARDQCRRLHGQRLLYDRSPALELCHGGRVTGIEWPEKYNGEWLFAWHDGKFASVHNSIIRLNPPPAEDVRAIGTSLLRAKSRWRFQQKEKDKDNNLWLKFDKNEAITNISCKCMPHQSLFAQGLCNNWIMSRSLFRLLVLGRHQRERQMGHLSQSIPRAVLGPGTLRRGRRPIPDPVKRDEQVVVYVQAAIWAASQHCGVERRSFCRSVNVFSGW